MSVSPPANEGSLPPFRIWRTAATFIVLLAVLALSLEWEVIRRWLIEPATRIEAFLAATILHLAGLEIEVRKTSLASNAFTMNVLNGCNGVYAFSIFLAAVLAYPSRWSEKAKGVILGGLFLFTVNLIRILSLFLIGLYLPGWLDWTHIYFWQTLIILISLLTWFHWESRWVHHA